MEVKQIQENLLKVMKDIHRVSVENNLEYTLDSGSLLGAIREKGFISWDDDIDILVKWEDYDAFMNVMREKLSWKIVDGLRDKGNFLMFSRICFNNEQFVDVVPYMNTKYNKSLSLRFWTEFKWFKHIKLNSIENKGERFGFSILKIFLFLIPDFFLIKMIRRRMKLINVAKGNNFYPCWNSRINRGDIKRPQNISNKITEIKFEDTKLFVLQDYDDILKYYYGADYMTPKKDNWKM